MANFEAGDKIVHALRSVLAQTMSDLEIIVSDDCSGDDSVGHVRRFMDGDSRIRLVAADRNRGPAACRNRALDMARGQWIAIVDSDDIIHPERFERLIAAAGAAEADIIADDLLLFFEDGAPPKLMLGEDASSPIVVTPERWILAGQDGSPALGYLKPMIRRDVLGALRYDEKLRIGEDYDLILRLLLAGQDMVVVPEPYYLYRRHSGSISHRLSVGDMAAMVERQDALIAETASLAPEIADAFDRRRASLNAGLAYERLVESIKRRRPGQIIGRLFADPRQLRQLFASFLEGRRRRRPTGPRPLSPLLLLGAKGTPGVAQTVPDYKPVAANGEAAASSRQVWRDLAATRGQGAVRCIPLDAAGRYAAGFIPEAEIASVP
ncbi:glycosyltransferase family 2 protein [Devosia lucknowensis]|nr:glycosyltransferase family 2 protein [Devosia lucknowensis]